MPIFIFSPLEYCGTAGGASVAIALSGPMFLADDEEALMEGKLQLKCAEPVLLTRETCNTAAKSYSGAP